MDKLNSFLEEKLVPIATKLGSNRYLGIIRDAMCANLALLIIGSIAILLANVPNETISQFLEPANPFFIGVFNVTTGLLGISTAIGIAYFGSRQFHLDSFSTTAIVLASFLVTQIQEDGLLSSAGLGAEGLLTAILVGFSCLFVVWFCNAHNVKITLPDGVPPAVANSFSSLIPGAITISLFGLISIVWKFNINSAMSLVFTPLSSILNTLPGYMLYHMLCGLVFFCGIHNNVITGVLLPFMLVNGTANETAMAAGKVAQYVAVQSTDAMVMMGGTGATLGLVILMSFIAKSQYFKSLGKMSLLPAIFNINEPIVFGTPICFNALFFIPFVFVPGLIAGLTYFLMSSGIIGMPVMANLPWSTPFFLQGFLICGGNILATLWPFIVIVISIILYFPFFKIADNIEYEKEQATKS